jgi:hypothetical protein
MENGADVSERTTVRAAVFKLVGLNIVGEAQRNEVLPLLGSIQAIDYQDVIQPAPIERPNDGAAHKASATGDYNSSAV